MAYIRARAEIMARTSHDLPINKALDEVDHVEFVTKEIWDKISKELKCKEHFTKITINGSKDYFILVCQKMKKEILEAVDLSNEAKEVREKKANAMKEALEAETAEKNRREQELRKELESLPDDIVSIVLGHNDKAIKKRRELDALEIPEALPDSITSEVTMNIYEAIEKYKNVLTPLQLRALRKMGGLKEEEE